MKETLNEYLKNLSKKSNYYVKTDDLKEISNIYEECMSFFNVSEVEIWNYNDNSKIATLLTDNSKVLTTVTRGLIFQAISTKTVTYTNHAMSDKNYNASIDNSHSYKIKAMLVCPIYKHDRLIGLINLYRNISNKKSFTSKDITNMSSSAPILSMMLQKILIESDELSSLAQKKKIKNPPKHLSKVPTKPIQTNHQTIRKEEKKEFENEKKELQNKIQELENEKKELEQNKTKLLKNNKELEDDKKELNSILETKKSTLHKVETSLKTLTKTFHSNALNITQLEEKNLKLEKENKKLSKDNEYLKEKHAFLEKILSEKDESLKLNELVRKIYLANQTNETMMTFLELALFIEDFANIPDVIEESLKKSKVTTQLLNVSSFKNRAMNNEKHTLRKVLKRILNNCNTILQPKNNKLKIHLNEKTPISLVFNAQLVESILTRFIIRIPSFLRENEAINMSVGFTDKQLNINLNFNIEREKKFVNLFQSNKDLLYDNSQLFYHFNAKLLDSFGGKIDTSYQENKYIFKLQVPAVTIKL